MTVPRQILPGSYYLVTRRCTQRQFLLRPSTLTNQIIEYCVAVAAEQTEVRLHAVCVMSNHWHVVVSDPLARLPEFLERVHRSVAKALNAALGRWENFWSSDKPSVVRLATERDVLDKMAYVLANPTLAGLVKSPHEWPGVITSRLGETRSVPMPDVFFDEDGELPDEIDLEFARPTIYEELDDAALNSLLSQEVAGRVRAARRTAHAKQRGFVGARSVLHEPALARPRFREHHRTLSPRVAARSVSSRVAALDEMQRFRREYRHAWLAWSKGDHDTRFPLGTYAMRVRHSAAIESRAPN